jgi:hypothetical protein
MMGNMQEGKKPEVTAQALGADLVSPLIKRLQEKSTLKEPGKDIKDPGEESETPSPSPVVPIKEGAMQPDKLSAELQALGASMQEASQQKMKGGGP